ncbi:MAG: hypothetical protein CVU57_30215 [Deltaproteobacteria bacterium HGW-Deltaproteobacteria-15]|jgi:hypothetical protein|nr:MAG: hypothetical protein CVU57_30215 [Deltaproteobacteria bacterium HGW-Deltaproteobacteria-15]
MKKFGAKGQRWLKVFHLFFACLWVGGAVTLCSKQFFVNPADGGELYGILWTLRYVDDWIIIPGAMGSLLTGLLYSLKTNWGWFKHRWVTVKWVINLYGVIFGTFWLGPWLNSLPPIAKTQGIQALSDPVFAHNRTMLLVFGTFQAATCVFAVFVSVLKPWKTRGQRSEIRGQQKATDVSG